MEYGDHDARGARFGSSRTGIACLLHYGGVAGCVEQEVVMARLEKVALFTNEYPPNVYGGAGVHVEYLSRELARLVPVEVRCFGDQDVQSDNLRVKGYGAWAAAKENTDPRFGGALDAFSRNLAMAKDTLDANVVHCHTWYTDMAGVIAKRLWNTPLVVTIHSLEPLRPWKVEQLGNAYHLSSWMERTAIEDADAVIAVSQETRNDVLRFFNVPPEKIHVVHNGIDLQQYRNDRATDALERRGVDPSRPFVLFVGRITRQKGIIHLVNAIPAIDPSLQVVLCAGAPDTKEIGEEMSARIDEVSKNREGIIWIREMLPRADVIQFYSRAAVFCCPSVYEPFGIINLEAMACETAVVASAVGGIPEVVVPDETGLLVDLALKEGTFDPIDPAKFSHDLATAINTVGLDPNLQAKFGRNGRRRVEDHFSWTAIAQRTLDLYESLV
jgi:glycogen synthase